ncbi:hypothetical protein K435DRAFT_810412 [Dendrothele bispora CBS 962.96]|uniref:Uncharacterized protein n=1 Tax=Dendrothele bispora (strain CBS 962.96) TaxID=1314807 RepID=A0A4S8KV48_DENBC|nr:hypothetical protein K435DRAFT_810412 [Dendrothele bispora CBS 962.96]
MQVPGILRHPLRFVANLIAALPGSWFGPFGATFQKIMHMLTGFVQGRPFGRKQQAWSLGLRSMSTIEAKLKKPYHVKNLQIKAVAPIRVQSMGGYQFRSESYRNLSWILILTSKAVLRPTFATGETTGAKFNLTPHFSLAPLALGQTDVRLELESIAFTRGFPRTYRSTNEADASENAANENSRKKSRLCNAHSNFRA